MARPPRRFPPFRANRDAPDIGIDIGIDIEDDDIDDPPDDDDDDDDVIVDVPSKNPEPKSTPWLSERHCSYPGTTAVAVAPVLTLPTPSTAHTRKYRVPADTPV